MGSLQHRQHEPDDPRSSYLSLSWYLIPFIVPFSSFSSTILVLEYISNSRKYLRFNWLWRLFIEESEEEVWKLHVDVSLVDSLIHQQRPIKLASSAEFILKKRFFMTYNQSTRVSRKISVEESNHFFMCLCELGLYACAMMKKKSLKRYEIISKSRSENFTSILNTVIMKSNKCINIIWFLLPESRPHQC